MALNAFKCNYLTPLDFKGLKPSFLTRVRTGDGCAIEVIWSRADVEPHGTTEVESDTFTTSGGTGYQ